MADPHDSVKRWLAVATVVVGLGSVGLSQVRQQQIVEKVEREADLRVATQCVASHERIEQIRDATEDAVRGGAKVGAEAASNALIQIGIEKGSPPEPGVEPRYRELLGQYIQEQSDAEVTRARNNIGSPECDLQDAKRTLENDE